MNAVIIEAVVTPDHQLRCNLPNSLPIGCKLRVTVEPIEREEPRPASLDAPPRTSLWARLAKLREQAAREGALPVPLSCDGILAEMEQRRGERNA